VEISWSQNVSGTGGYHHPPEARWRQGNVLRYLAEAAPEEFRQQLPLEQVPMKGAP